MNFLNYPNIDKENMSNDQVVLEKSYFSNRK